MWDTSAGSTIHWNSWKCVKTIKNSIVVFFLLWFSDYNKSWIHLGYWLSNSSFNFKSDYLMDNKHNCSVNGHNCLQVPDFSVLNAINNECRIFLSNILQSYHIALGVICQEYTYIFITNKFATTIPYMESCKQCRPWSEGFHRSPLCRVYTICLKRPTQIYVVFGIWYSYSIILQSYLNAYAVIC